MTTHARLSASGAHRWMNCPGSVALEANLPDSTSEYAAEGTAAHFLAAICLEKNQDAKIYLDRMIAVLPSGEATFNDYPHIAKKACNYEFAVDTAMVAHVQTYIDAVRDYAHGGELMVEQRVDFSQQIGVPKSFGTSDAIVITDNATELQVHDLKYGMGNKVDAEHNEQLCLYALGSLNDFGFLGDFKRVRVVIHQPRLEHVSEWSYSIDQLEAFAEQAKTRASIAIELFDSFMQQDSIVIEEVNSFLVTGDKQCKFCKAKATCPALTKHVLNTVLDDFVDLSALDDLPQRVEFSTEALEFSDNNRLAQIMNAADLIEGFIKAVRARVEAELFIGNLVSGYKLVQGKKGNRKWADDAEAETTLKTMRLKLEQMYDLKLISPTTAEKLAKAGDIGPRQWPKVQALITQSEGKPSVAPESDKRPALIITATIDDFADETQPA